jgi:hypothetical protein
MATYKGRSYSFTGSPLDWYADDDGSPAPPEAVAAISERGLAKLKRLLGHKRAGRKKLKEKGVPSRPEQMLADLLENNYDFEATAERFGVKPKTVEDNIRKLRQ